MSEGTYSVIPSHSSSRLSTAFCKEGGRERGREGGLKEHHVRFMF